MKVTLKNNELVPCIEFLQKMNLPANSSRPIVKFVKLLNDALTEVQKSQMALIEQYGVRDEDGQLALTEDKQDYLISAEYRQNYNEEMQVFLLEEVVITGGMFVNVVSKLPTILEKYDEKISNQDAVIYDRLMDEFEKNEEGVTYASSDEKARVND